MIIALSLTANKEETFKDVYENVIKMLSGGKYAKISDITKVLVPSDCRVDFDKERLMCSYCKDLNVEYYDPVLEDIRSEGDHFQFDAICSALKSGADMDSPFLYVDLTFLVDAKVFPVLDLWRRRNLVYCFGTAMAPKYPSAYSVLAKGTGKILTKIEEAVSPEKSSDTYMTCGLYGFERFADLASVVRNRSSSERSTPNLILQKLTESATTFQCEIVPRHACYCLGSLSLVHEYRNNVFLFDLDGTLVQTDHIYTDVWKKVLAPHDLSVDRPFFDHFIRGKSDFTFLRFLMPSISLEDIKQLSETKDQYFNDALATELTDVVNRGAREMLERMSNSRMGLVTSCNGPAARFILDKTGLKEFFSVIVAAEDTPNHKPHPEPYLKAMRLLSAAPSDCIIFEDSISGYWSAKHANPRNVIIFTGLESGPNIEILNLKDEKFDSYVELDYISITKKQEIKGMPQGEKHRFATLISRKLGHLPLRDVLFCDEQLKTGYICDINAFNLSFTNGETEKVVLKMSNLGNELANVAIQLDMYEIEAFFYESLSSLVKDDIRIPKSYGTIRDGQRVGIIMEDLRRFPGHFDKDLNRSTESLMCVVRNIHHMHSKFQFKTHSDILPAMASLKTVKEITYYNGLVQERFDIFFKKNQRFFSEKSRETIPLIFKAFPLILDGLSSYPLSFCHGDLKSPNIFYKDGTTPFFLDWQYAHLNKGVSDVAFLLVESINFDPLTVNLASTFYFKLENEANKDYTWEVHQRNFRLALCMFPFFVMVWFNSEDGEKLLDRTFPLKFMKNLLCYYDEYISTDFLRDLLQRKRKSLA